MRTRSNFGLGLSAEAAKLLAVDFDGVLFPYSEGYKDGTLYEGPMPGAVEAIKALVKSGYTYYVFTARMSFDDHEKQEGNIAWWLGQHGFPTPLAITNRKMPAVAYIDDRGVRFTNWDDIRKLWV